LFQQAIEQGEMARARVALIAARAANVKPDKFKKILKGFGG